MNIKDTIIFLFFLIIMLCIVYPKFENSESFRDWVEVKHKNQNDIISTDNIVTDYQIVASQGNCTNCNPKCSIRKA